MSKEKQIEEMAETLYQGERNRCTHISCHDCHYDANNDDFCREKAIAEYLYDAGYRKQEWISVGERLPEEFVSVLGHMTDAGDFPAVRECYRVGKAFFFPALRDIHPVSHWMPLPEPPIMKQTEN